MTVNASEAEHEVMIELLELVDLGLLHMGLGDEGDVVFWPTIRGVLVLGMVL